MPNSMYLKTVAVVLTLSAISLAASANQQPAEANSLSAKKDTSVPWMTILPRTPIRSMKEYHHTYLFYGLSNKLKEKIPFELRIISSDHKNSITIPDIASNALGGGVQLNKSQRRMADGLSNGDYFVAVYANGIRCSNVAHITINSDFDALAEPILSLVPLPLGPGQKLPLLGIRAVGPTPQDSKFTNYSIAFPMPIVDGVERKLKIKHWIGPVAPLESGKIYVTILSLDGYEPAIEAGKKHTVKAIVGKYESEPVVIPADDISNQQWDSPTQNYPDPNSVSAGQRENSH